MPPVNTYENKDRSIYAGAEAQQDDGEPFEEKMKPRIPWPPISRAAFMMPTKTVWP